MIRENAYALERKKVDKTVRTLIKKGYEPEIYRNFPDGFHGRNYRYKKDVRQMDYPIVDGRVQWDDPVEKKFDARGDTTWVITSFIFAKDGKSLWYQSNNHGVFTI